MFFALIDKAKVRRSPMPTGKFVALDLDSKQLRVVCAEPGKQLPKFRKMAVVDVPEDLDLNDANAVGQFIAKALDDLGMRGMAVVMDVPRRQAVLKTLTLPPVDSERELPAMVRYQVERELPFPIADAVVDFTVDQHFNVSGTNGHSDGAADGPQNTDVLVAAVKRDIVEHYEAIAVAADIKLQSLGLRPYADARCLDACISADRRTENRVLVHVLGDEAEINIMIHGMLAFSRSAVIKQSHEGEPEPTEQQVCEALVLEVGRSVQSVLSSQRGLTMDRVYLAGATGIESTVADALSARLKAPCELLCPIEVLNVKKAKIEGEGFLTPLGLAIVHGSEGEIAFDFLHPKEPPIERDLKKIRNMAIAASVGLLLMIGLLWGMAYRSSYTSQLATLVQTSNELEKQRSPIEKLLKRVSTIDDWQNEGRDWLDHWANLTSLLPDATDAYITSLKTFSDGSISFTVKASSKDVITQLTKRLAASGYNFKLGTELPVTNDPRYTQSTTIKLFTHSAMTIKVDALKAPPRPSDDGSATMIRYGYPPSSRSSSSSSRNSSSSSNSSSQDRDDNRNDSSDNSKSESKGDTKDDSRNDRGKSNNDSRSERRR